jgi:hypothetical protein
MRYFICFMRCIRLLRVELSGAPLGVFAVAMRSDHTRADSSRRSHLLRRRHASLLLPVFTLACRAGQTTLRARLVALAGLALGQTPRFLCALAAAIDLTAVAAAADNHLRSTKLTHQQAARHLRPFMLVVPTWTTFEFVATRRAHPCSTRCEGTVPSPAWQLGRRRACHFRQVVTAPSALTHAVMRTQSPITSI